MLSRYSKFVNKYHYKTLTKPKLFRLHTIPYVESVAGVATGPALVIVDVMMCAHTTNVNWDDYTEAIPAFITIMLIRLMLGLIMCVLMKTVTGMKGIRQISPAMWVLFVIFVLLTKEFVGLSKLWSIFTANLVHHVKCQLFKDAIITMGRRLF